jgi:hypothetical protein
VGRRMCAGWWVRRLCAVAVSGVLACGVSVLGFGQPAAASDSVATIARSSWAYLDSRTPDTGYFDRAADAPVGKLHDDVDGNHVYRSYFTFDVGQFLGRRVSAVTLFAAERQAADCRHRSVQLWTTEPVTALTTWNHPPAERQKIDTAGYLSGTVCPSPRVEWAATVAVQQAVAAGQRLLTLELRESNEESPLLGRRFDNDLRMTVVYDTPPDLPTPVKADSAACTATGPYPWVASLQPTLYARVNDPDGESVDVTFAVWPLSNPADRRTYQVTSYPSGSTAQRQLPEGSIVDGGTYGWAAQATDPEGLTSEWSSGCYFQVDATRPATAPLVSSTDYPADGGVHGGQGIPGLFTFSANGVADVVGFSYGWTGVPQGGYIAADQLGGSATVSLAPPNFTNILSVVSVDRAGNTSPTVNYTFFAAPTVPIVSETGQPKAGGSIQLTFHPGVNLPGYAVVGYRYSVNAGASQAVAAGSDGTATVTVSLVYGFNTVTVNSVSANGWASPATQASYYADNSPTVSSADFPENGTGGAVGQPGTFTFTSNLAGSVEFAYSFDYGATFQSVPVGPDGKASITWTPDVAGDHSIFVYSETAGGTQSDWYFYDFSVNSQATGVSR